MPEMEPADGPYSLENEQQFWSELERILSEQCDAHAVIDNVLRSYLSFCVQFKEDFLVNEYDISRCSYKLFSSSLFAQHADYIRRQIIYSLLQEDDPIPLHFIVSFLLFDGRQNVSTFQLMNEQLTNEASSFARLLELIYSTDSRNGDNAGLHRMLMDLLYEMSRIQRIKIEDLVFIDDDFVRYLFDIIEGLSDDAQDPYHYTVIRVLLVLNEQFMVQSHDPDAGTSSNTLTNKIMKVLSMHGNIYKTFGENIILLLNREGETSLQLLTLKLLYLIFTTPTTYEYFYTNDLRVLVDILIRNLLDLPEEAIALRHTYLRVFYPLLAHTQLKYHPHYKREEIRRTLSILVHSRIEGNESDCERIMHFSEADDTTKRLVSRCSQVEWLYDRENEHRSKIPDSPEEDGPKDITGISISDLHGTNPEILSDSSITQSTDAAATSRDKIEGASTVNPPSVKKAISDMHNTASNVSAHTTSTGTISAEGQDPVIPAIQSVDFTDASNRATTRQKPQLPKPRRPKGSHVSVENTDTRGRSALLSENRHPPTLKVSPESSSETLPVPKNASTSRSTSRPAPAVPPPRRSINHVSQTAMTSENHHSSHPPLSTKTSIRPQPPRTRRWQHGAKLSTETLGTEDERSASPASVSSSFHAKEANDENQSCDSTASIKQALERTNLEA